MVGTRNALKTRVKSAKVAAMAHEVPGWPVLLAGTVLLRPYVFVFIAVFLVLFISNVPFFDPLSFPFLAYASYCSTRWTLGQAGGWAPAALTGALMMLDVVVDPLAVLGERWFLGRIFYYAEPGTYFGEPCWGLEYSCMWPFFC